MAKNTGVLKFQGTIEELTYYKTQDGDIVRKRGGIAKSRILTEPSEVDFNSGAYNFTAGAAELLPIDMTPIPSLVVEPGANPGTLPGASLLVFLLVEFSQQVNGEQYPVGSSYNALGIVHVGTVG